MLPGRNMELTAHRRPPPLSSTCCPSRLSLSMRRMLPASSMNTFCVWRSPPQNTKSNSAASTTWWLGMSSSNLGPSCPAHSALTAMPSAGEEKMPSWFTGTSTGCTFHGSRGSPAGATPRTCATHERVEMRSMPQKSVRRCRLSVFTTSRSSGTHFSPFLQTVLCRGRPGMHTNFTKGLPPPPDSRSARITVAEDAPVSRTVFLSRLNRFNP
mmetsp:Transcript_24769/g.60987  ORF Transcript_24769/g.60987 Transcript_24769/m.60987 type:complete len:212 (+) Transcript_24769:121-756(+)